MNKGSIVERLCSDLDRKEPRYKSPTLLFLICLLFCIFQREPTWMALYSLIYAVLSRLYSLTDSRPSYRAYFLRTAFGVFLRVVPIRSTSVSKEAIKVPPPLYHWRVADTGGKFGQTAPIIGAWLGIMKSCSNIYVLQYWLANLYGCEK